MHTPRVLVAVATTLFASACTTYQGPPSVGANLAFSNAYIFRGVPQVDALVFQPDATLALPMADGSTASLTVWGNYDLESDAGDAVFTGGNAGSFTEIDVVPEYAWTAGDLLLSAGFVDYNFPAGGKSTTEAYFGVAGGFLGLDASATAYYDFDEVDGLYVSGALSKAIEVGEKTTVDFGASLGIADDDQGNVYFFAEETDLADLNLTAGLSYALSDHTSLFGRLNASTIVGSDYGDAIEAAGIETDNLWLVIGVGWSF
jgi:hypothetical protein